MNYVLVINEQHTLLDSQRGALEKFGWTGATLSVPANGWTLAEIKVIADKTPHGCAYIFASPVPALMKIICRHRRIYVFHNDLRDKVEVDGKVTYRVAKEGWVIV